MLTATLRDDNGAVVGVLVLSEKAFKSGSVGLFGQAKITLEDGKYQAQAQLVKIGSGKVPGAPSPS